MKPPAEDQDVQEVHHRHAAHGGSHGGLSRRDHVVISTVFVGVALFLLVGTPYLKYHMPQGEPILNTIGGGNVDSERDRALDRGRDGHRDVDGDRDRDREAVRQWLRENADDPRPHEIRWWPARELTRLHQERMAAAREAAEDDPRLADDVDRFDEEGPDRVCRLEYRTKNEAGDDVTRDDLFVVRQGKARLLARDSSLAQAARKAFVDAQGVP